VATTENICQSEEIVAYIEGDLDAERHTMLEEHVAGCASCAAELRAQRLFMCELDSVLATPFELEVPPNFAQVVAVHAESDMRGARDRSEHKKALRFCIILGLLAFALLGAAASKAVVLNLRSGGSKVVGVLGFSSRAALDAASGLGVISRVVSRGVIPDSRLVTGAALLLIVLAIAALSFLISRYHRTRVTE
jgi:anti-sigma factor RsiW